MPASRPSKARIAAIEAAGLKDQFCRDYASFPSIDDVVAKYAVFLDGINPAYQANVITQIANAWGARRVPTRRQRTDAAWERRVEPVPDDVLEDARQVAADRERERLKAEKQHAERLYRAAIREQAWEDRVVESFENAQIRLEPAPLRYLREVLEHDPLPDPHAAVAMLSDLHLFENVAWEHTGGLGRFNPQIAARRLGFWGTLLPELVDLRRSRLYIPDLYLLLGGDILSGNIHEELSRTNGPTNMADQVIGGAHLLAQAIRLVAPHFRHVYITAVVGNHGRMTHKMPAKNRHENFDYLTYRFAEELLKDQSNVTWNISKSFFEMVDVLGFRVLLMHGDSIRGSLGIPYYGIERANARMRQVEAMGKLPQHDIMCIGHFHDLMENSRFIINGSLKGSDEYSAGMLHVADQPMQVLFYVKQPYGIVSTEKLYLAAGDERPDCELATGLGPVWAAAG